MCRSMRSAGKRRLRFGWARVSLRPTEPRSGLLVGALQRHDLDQQPIPLVRQLLYAASGGFRLHPGNDLLSYRCGQLGTAEVLPPVFHGAGELIEEVADLAHAAGEMESQMRAHQRPSQARSLADRRVDVGDIGDALGEEMDRLRHKAAGSRLATCPLTSRRMCIGRLPSAA